MARIFISYSWDSDAHRAWIRQLSNDLESKGHTVWFDHRNLGPGQNSLEFMREGIRRADFVLPICTPNYVLRFDKRLGGVGIEAKAIESRWNGSPNRDWVIPILRGRRKVGINILPSLLRGIIAADMRTGSAAAKDFRRLVWFLADPKVFERSFGSRALAPVEAVILNPEWLVRRFDDLIRFGQKRPHRGLCLKKSAARRRHGDFVFCTTEELAFESGEINAVAFQTQKWKGRSNTLQARIEEKQLRNAAHAHQNSKTLLLFRPKGTGSVPYWGFSHVLPLTKQGFRHYCEGKLEDNDFPSEAIAKPRETAVAILIFSVGLHPGRLQHANPDRKLIENLGSTRLVLEALAFHLYHLVRVHGRNGRAQLIAQTERRSLHRMLSALGFRAMDGIRSADGFPILSAIVQID